ncbi:MAG: carbohydrate ABC transporter permease [Oscillospiraceae bacterium]|nr:carbohydrate ABC transporter permease [Oscillospiraceae bacterium]
MSNKLERTGVIREFDVKTPRVKAGIAFIYLACAVIVVISLYPLVWAFLSGFKTYTEFMTTGAFLPENFDLAQYVTTWKELKFTKNYLNSLWSVAGSVVCALVFNGVLAYGLSILKPKGYKLVLALVMISLLIPATTSLVPLFFNITRIGLVIPTFSEFFWPLWLATGAMPFFVVLFKQFFDDFPKSIIEASRIDGCGSLQVFYRIVMPMSKPICVVVAIYAINGAWSDFLLPYLILRGSPWETVMVQLFTYQQASHVNEIVILRAVVFAVIPPILLFLAFQKQLTQNLVSSGIKG